MARKTKKQVQEATEGAIEAANEAGTDSEFVARLKAEAATRLVSASGGAGSANNGIKALAEGRSDIFRVNPYTITVVNDFNAREFWTPDNIAHVERLTLDISENGLKEPLTVYWNKGLQRLELVDGECRLRAIKRAIEQRGNTMLAAIAVKTEVAFSSPQDRMMSQITRNGAKGFSPIERSTVFYAAHELGMTLDEIARKAVSEDGVGLTATRVRQVLNIRAGLTPKVRKLIGEGYLSFSRFGSILKECKEDSEAAETAVLAQFAVAQSRGEGRIFQKHAKLLNGGAPRINVKKVVISVLGAAQVKKHADTVSITMSMADFKKLEQITG